MKPGEEPGFFIFGGWDANVSTYSTSSSGLTRGPMVRGVVDPRVKPEEDGGESAAETETAPFPMPVYPLTNPTVFSMKSAILAVSSRSKTGRFVSATS